MPRISLPTAARATACLLAVVGIMLSATAVSAKGPRTGEVIPIRGQVVDGEGRSLAGVEVVLEARRERLRLKSFQREAGAPLRVLATTDTHGRFEIEWTWDRHHNQFDLIIAHTGRDKATVESFASQDITDKLRAGGPVAVQMHVPEGSVLRWLRRYHGPTTEAERNVYEQMGRPDRVDMVIEGTGDELSWWYFEAGKVYRFKDGALAGVTPFDPVRAPR